MAVMHHSIINSRVWIKTQTLSDLTDGCVHAAGPSKTGGGVLEDRGAANPKRVRLCVSVCFYGTTCRRKRVVRVARKKSSRRQKRCCIIKHALFSSQNTMLSNLY